MLNKPFLASLSKVASALMVFVGVGAYAHSQQPSHIDTNYSSVAKYFQFQVEVSNVRNDNVDIFDLAVLDYETKQPIPFASTTRVFRLREGERKKVSVFIENRGKDPLYVCTVSRTNPNALQPTSGIKTQVCSKVSFK